MAQAHSFLRRAGTTLAGLLAYFVIIVAVSVAWGFFLAATGATKGQGLAGGAMVIFVPMMLLVLAVIWSLVRVGLIAWRGYPGLLWTAGGAALCGLIFTIGYCGPVNCFVPGRNEALSGWFLIAGTALGALAQAWSENRLRG